MGSKPELYVDKPLLVCHLRLRPLLCSVSCALFSCVLFCSVLCCALPSGLPFALVASLPAVVHSCVLHPTRFPLSVVAVVHCRFSFFCLYFFGFIQLYCVMGFVLQMCAASAHDCGPLPLLRRLSAGAGSVHARYAAGFERYGTTRHHAVARGSLTDAAAAPPAHTHSALRTDSARTPHGRSVCPACCTRLHSTSHLLSSACCTRLHSTSHLVSSPVVYLCSRVTFRIRLSRASFHVFTFHVPRACAHVPRAPICSSLFHDLIVRCTNVAS